ARRARTATAQQPGGAYASEAAIIEPSPRSRGEGAASAADEGRHSSHSLPERPLPGAARHPLSTEWARGTCLVRVATGRGAQRALLGGGRTLCAPTGLS